eukprot:SAG11_NODE_32_length_22830_cov_17.507941_14_plen_200_part_00
MVCVRSRERRFLEFLCVLLGSFKTPIKFNQDRLSRIVAQNFKSDLYAVNLKSSNRVLIDFHNGLIEMAALLCAGRHRFSIDFFLTTVGISYSQVLKNIGDPSITFETRASYAKLMQTLFVDREPYELHKPVQLSRIMPPLSGTAQHIESRLGVKPPRAIDPYASFSPSVERPTAGFNDLKKKVVSMLGELNTTTVIYYH